MTGTRRLLRLAVILWPLALGGCLHMPAPGEGFPVESWRVEAEWNRMRSEPVGVQRPLVVIDGWLPMGSATISRELKDLTGADEDDVLRYAYGIGASVEAVARRVIDNVERRWPSDDPHWTREVDVVGYSMGGCVARLASLPPVDGPLRKRLRINALYTIATPHRGTIGIAAVLPIDRSARDMLGGSRMLQHLDAHSDELEHSLVCYGQLNDWIVGAKHTAPPDHDPIWTPGPRLFSHMLSCGNRRFLADIALRLRSEPPLAAEPSSPPHN